MGLSQPIVTGLRELIGRFDPEFQQRMLQNIVLGGGGSQLRGLDRVIEEAMTEYGGANGGAAALVTPSMPERLGRLGNCRLPWAFRSIAGNACKRSRKTQQMAIASIHRFLRSSSSDAKRNYVFSLIFLHILRSAFSSFHHL